MKNFSIRPKNFFERLFDRRHAVVGSDKNHGKGCAVIKLTLAAATTAVFFCSGLALSNQAKAEDLGNGYQSNGYAQPQGEAGSRWGNQCWVETWGAGSSYFGYWKACPTPQPARTAKR